MTIVAQARRTKPPVRSEVAALASLPPGPALCAALISIDITAVSGYEMVLVLQARARQGNYERGMYLAAVAETMRRTDPEHGTLAEHELGNRRKWNVAELRAALVLTRTAANSVAALADDLSRRLPAVLAAMLSGRLDQPRARVFSSWTEQLGDRHAQAVVERLLPRAPQLTTGELIEAIQRVAIELDPRWARRRYENALRKRQVKGILRPDGTADLTGTNLPADQVAAACDRIDALAHRLKQAGYPSLLTWIRADIYLGKLDGRYEGMTDDELFAHLMANPVPKPAPDPEPETPDDHGTDEEWAAYYDYLVEHGLLDPDEFDDYPEAPLDNQQPPTPNHPDNHEDREDQDGGEHNADRTGEGCERHGDGEDRNHRQHRDGEDDEPGEEGEDGDGSADVDDGPEQPDDPPSGPPRPDDTGPDRPDQDISGGGAGVPGPSTPDTARSAAPNPADPPRADDVAEPDGMPEADDMPGAGDMPNADGMPDAAEPLRAAEAGRVRGRGLRLLVGMTTLAGVDRRPGQLLGFGFVHAELARRISATPAASWHYALVQPDGTPIQVGPIRRRPVGAWVEGHIPDYHHLEVWLQLTPDELARLTHDPPPGWQALITGLARRIATHHHGAPNGDPTARLPGKHLRRWLYLRDRRCVFPGCRIAPHRTDADHTIEHARHGPTTEANLGCLCQPDHRLRHEHGWRVHQPQPGRFTWTSPLGHEYHRNPPPGPADTPQPMPKPTRICEDPFFVWVNGDLGYRGTETCKIIIPAPPPPPPPLGDPPF